MTVLKQQFGKLNTIAQKLLALCALIGLISAAGAAQAQENAIETVSANQQGANVVVKIVMKNPVTKPPIGFSINSPARIVIDFAGTTNATGESTQQIGLGDVRTMNVVQAGERSRLVFNLTRPLNYATVLKAMRSWSRLIVPVHWPHQSIQQAKRLSL